MLVTLKENIGMKKERLNKRINDLKSGPILGYFRRGSLFVKRVG